jgi:hypothetical protein
MSVGLGKEESLEDYKINADKYIFCDENNIIPKNKKKDKNNDEIMGCAPGIKNENGSCFTLDNLVELVKAYNKFYEKKNKHILLKWEDLKKDTKEYKKYLVKSLSKELADVCDDQMCWLKQEFVKIIENPKLNELKSTFRPIGPQGKFTWLNTINIDEIMEQYEKQYPNFKYLRTVPLDFDHIEKSYRLSMLDYKGFIKQNKTIFGTIVNMDKHNEPGSHWVGVVVDFNKGESNFLDSYGEEPPEEIQIYMNNMKKLYNDLYKKKMKIKYNDNRYQYKNSECGVYSINFILRYLSGHDMDFIINNNVKDDDINVCRQVYYN